MKKNTKWPIKEQASFLKKIGELLCRGYPLDEAIESLSFYLEPGKREGVKECLASLKEGYPFYQILLELKFNKNLVNYVYFAEKHGNLARSIIEGSEMMLKREQDFHRLKSLLSYPLLLVFMTAVLFYFVDNILLPRFNTLYEDMNVNPSIFTTFLLIISKLLPVILCALVSLLLFALLYDLYFFRKQSKLHQRTILVKIPYIGKILRLLYSHSFAVQLSYLFSGGLSVNDALDVFEKNSSERFSVEFGRVLKNHLASGMDLVHALALYPFFEAELGKIIHHGQKNGKVDQELYLYSRHCLALLEERTEKLMKIVQPVLFACIGLLIVSLYLAILMPMFRLLQEI